MSVAVTMPVTMTAVMGVGVGVPMAVAVAVAVTMTMTVVAIVIMAVVPVPAAIIMMVVVTIGRAPVERDTRPAISVPVRDAAAVIEKPAGAAIPIGLGGGRGDRHHAETGEQRKRKAKGTSHD